MELMAEEKCWLYSGCKHRTGSCLSSQPVDDGCPVYRWFKKIIKEQESTKYEYHIDHTDCLWYSNSRSRCPVTCSQYRDGWNDAMDYVFRNGHGYKPYKRGENE